MKTGILYLVPSPIDIETTEIIPTHTRNILKRLDFFLVENIRSARRYISSLKMGIVIENLEFEVYDQKTTFDETMELLMPVVNGRDAGVISEAGCPGVADPGALAVSAAHQLGIKVVPLVGPSSILMALMASGFSGQSFAFHGYLPIDKVDRKKRIKHLENEAVKKGQSQIFMEAPYRNDQLFTAILEACHPQTRLCVACNITSASEMIKTLSIQSWKKQKPDLKKKPTIFIIGS